MTAFVQIMMRLSLGNRATRHLVAEVRLANGGLTQRRGLALEDDAPLEQTDHVVRDTQGFGDVLFDEQQCGPFAAMRRSPS